VTWDKSSYLDMTSWRSYGLSPTATVQEAFGLDPGRVHAATSETITLALVLPRVEDATALLQSDWGARQKALADLTADGTLWERFGADKGQFDATVDALHGLGAQILGEDRGYVTSAESRTIWVSLNADQFEQLFQQQLFAYDADDPDESFTFWNGELDPQGLDLAGLFVEGNPDPAEQPLVTDPVELPQGGQGIGNGADPRVELLPQDIAAYYDFPLTGDATVDGTLGLIETGIGSALPEVPFNPVAFANLLAGYLYFTGQDAVPETYTVAPAGQTYDEDAAGERSLDIGVVAAVNPHSTIGLYAGANGDGGSVYATYQAAIWDLTHDLSVLSSSFADAIFSAPGSPAFAAYQELFVDAALRNLSVFIAAGDGGSGSQVGNGLTNIQYPSSSPYTVLVGGTSLTTATSVADDPGLAGLLRSAEALDADTLWTLVAGGLKALPGGLSPDDFFVETVWNDYVLREGLLEGYLLNETGAGGVDTRLPVPDYQADYGLLPASSDPVGGTGRGVPDVAALSAGNMLYVVPDSDMEGTMLSGGTSAATPLWAALALQIETIFGDQGLPRPGYMNDLLYIASAVAPAAFNDVTLGNNTSSYVEGNAYQTENPADPDSPDTVGVNPTGFGYAAGEGYDLTTGLGTPNGILLTRALTTIAHSQLYFDLPPVLQETDSGWRTPGDQNLLFQANFQASADWSLTAGGETRSAWETPADSFAWTARLAQQSLQADFADDLVTFFDGHGQGSLFQADVAGGLDLALSIGGLTADAPQAALTADYGFATFEGDGLGGVTVARPLAIATTAGGADDQDAVVRLRQNGGNDLSVLFYRVDDFEGAIDGVRPGDAGYADAAASRAYATSTGATWIDGAGYGAYSEARVTGVDAGDLVAMSLFNGTDTFWAFDQANETADDGSHVGHLWSYGLDTWGWEDLYGGGDRDFNDLVVQLDFNNTTDLLVA